MSTPQDSVEQDQSDDNSAVNNAPDPLLGENTGDETAGDETAATPQASAKARYQSNLDKMSSLEKQYGEISGRQSDAYDQQRKVLQQATQRLLGMQMGPSQNEQMARLASSWSAPGGAAARASATASTQADLLQQQRESEMQRQQLLQQYGMQIPQATLGSTNANLNRIIQEERIAQSGINSSAGQQTKGVQATPWWLNKAADGSVTVPPGAADAMNIQQASKLFGKVSLLPQPDGSKKIVPLKGFAITTPGTGQGTTPSPQNNPAHPSITPAPASDPYLSDLFVPSTVMDPKYSRMTSATVPAYVSVAKQAIEPQYFSGYKWNPTVMGSDKIYQKQLEEQSKGLSAGADSAQSIIYNYGQALQNMDQLSDPKLRTGPAGQQISAFENAIRGVSPELAEKITNDPEMKKLATSQDTDKYFLQAASTGLKSIYGARITNMEVKQRLAAMPSNNLLPEVTRMLSAAQADQAQDTVNKSKLFGLYTEHGGDPNPTKFQTWYDSNFSPFGNSRLHRALSGSPAPVAASAAVATPLPKPGFTLLRDKKGMYAYKDNSTGKLSVVQP